VSHKYQDLIAWQKAKALATAIYRATGPFPKTEIYGMPSQLRRAAISTASNIAEAPPARGRILPLPWSGKRVVIGIGNTTFGGC